MIRNYLLEKWQGDFVKSTARFPAMVSAWGTGKTLCGLLKAVHLCEAYPENLVLIFRREFTDLRDSTIKDFEKYTGMKVDSSRDYRFPNKSVLMFRHLEELNNLQNINAGAFVLEQAEELDTDEEFQILRGRLRREDVPHQGIIIANTKGHNWIYKAWKLHQDNDFELFEAKTFDNAVNLPPDFIEDLKKLEKLKPKLYNRFVMNSWDESDTVDVIVDPEWVQAAVRRSLGVSYPIRRVVSIDVARYGDDKMIFYALENYRVIGKEEHTKRSTMEAVGLAQLFAKKHKDIQTFAVDEIGVGAGVADRLAELGKKVIYVNASKKSFQPEKYYNVRAEIYSTGADLFEAGKVQLLTDDDDLTEQLSWAKYKTIKSNGIYQVEAKEDIKERYGRSPDNADCLLNGLWAISRTDDTIVKKHDAWGREDKSVREINPDTV